jgi:transposase-like protein
MELFQTAWTDHLRWLEKSVKHMEKAYNEAFTATEKERLKHKLEGLKVAYGHMMDSHKIYELCVHDNAINEYDNRYYCPDCNKKFTLLEV